MSKPEFPSTLRQSVTEPRPRHPQREIADLLATALLRMHAVPSGCESRESSAVRLAITGNQSVHVNPSYQEGVRQ